MLNNFQMVAVLLTILAMLVGSYIVGCLSYYFVFKALGIKTTKAFIPIYNAYTLYTEYEGRVWKKNWAVAFLFVIIVVPITLAVLAILTLTITNPNVIAILVLIMAVIMLVAFVFYILLPIVANWPLMTETWHKVVYIALIVIGVVFGGGRNSAGEYSPTNLTTYLGTVASLFTIYASYVIYKKVNSGSYKIVDKVDKKTMNTKEYAAYIASTEHCLIAKVDSEKQEEQQMYV